MKKIQDEIIIKSEKFRLTPNYPTYPPYHLGEYLEELFYKKFIKSTKLSYKSIYLPIFWTTVYNDQISGVQDFLNSLDKDLDYFTVCQHDDAVKEILPPKTTVYSAGGNNGNVPIPLVCSKIQNDLLSEKTEKTILASFVGSMTHPLRYTLYNTYNKDSDFFFKTKMWTPKINNQDLNDFFSITIKSKFSLCPRGYGKTSFRLYEALQLNSIPVYISDSFWLPFNEEIKWEEFSILIQPNQISDLKKILQSIDDVTYEKMLTKGKEIWNNFFEINKTCEKILNFYEN